MKAIDDQLINIIEHLFLPQGTSFDEERRAFIKNLSSCDLLAVPGSGKTTALLAKLACIANSNNNNDGILVLSHTNTAVDEIKKKLQGKFSLLFNYPNCVCTVQEFVDTFFAIPYYENLTHSSVVFIDKDRYEEELEYELSKIYDKRIQYLKKKFDFNIIRFGRKNGATTIGVGVDCDELRYVVPGTWAGHEEENKEYIISTLLSIKKKILRKGVLHYDDCYFLAELYLSACPDIISFIRKRFKYIFVDETQDLAKHQIVLLDRLFNCDECILQRVGDINQSIYHKVSENTFWIPRNEMYLNNSQRLTPAIAEVVNAFTLNKGVDEHGNPLFNVVGLRVLEQPIPPYLLLYEEGSMCNIENSFRDIINRYSLSETESGKKYGFHIIGWNSNKEEEYDVNKLRLEDIFHQFVISQNTTKTVLEKLSDYIQFGRTESSLRECRNSILNALCRILHLTGIKDDNNRYYSSKTLISHITQQEQHKESFEKKIYEIAALIVSTQYVDSYNALKSYILTGFASIMHYRITRELLDFIGENFEPAVIEEIHEAQPQMAFPIEISTVHHVKGMTHCATLYVETFYYEYECNHLIKETRGHLDCSPFFKDICNITGKRAKQAMKMLYVGMSRPTHLLCYASLKQNWNENRLQKMREAGWEIIEV